MGRLIDAEDIKARAKEAAIGMEEPWHSQFAILVEWLVDKTFTAYDTEKVIAEINNLPTHKEVATSEKHPFSAYEAEMISKHKVMGIVKKGGADGV